MKHIENKSVWQEIEAAIESADLNVQNHFSNDAIVTRCKELSSYLVQRDLDTGIVGRQDLSDKEDAGEIVNSHIFYRLSRHYFLKDKIEGAGTAQLSNLMYKLHSFLANQYYFPIQREAIKQVVELGCCYQSHFSESHSCQNEYLDRLVESTLYLKELGIELYVEMGSVHYDERIEQECFSRLDNMIAAAGGNVIGAELFHQYIPQHYPLLDRLAIGRRDDRERNEPVNIVLQLALKHIENPLRRQMKTRIDIKPIMRMAESWLDVMQIQGETSSEYSLMNLKQFPLYLNNELFFDKMCIPVQYSKRFIIKLLDTLIAPWFDDYTDKPYSFKDYRKVSEGILLLCDCSWFTLIDIKELSKKCKVAQYRVSQILKDLSIEFTDLNKGFCSLDGETNYNQYPIVHFPMRGYYCMERHLCGIGFYNVACRMIEPQLPILSRYQGEQVEQIIRDEMSQKGIKYHCGKYPERLGIPEGECDIVLDQNYLTLIEVKKRSADKEFDKVDDVSMLKTLSLGMVRAQKQAFSHECYLRKNHEMCMTDENGTFYRLQEPQNDRPPYKISVCLPEYSFLTNKMFCMGLMETLMVADFHTLDANRELEMEMLNNLANQIRNCIRGIYPNEKHAAHDLAFYSLFCSLQQILDAIWLADSEETLMEYLKWWMYGTSKNLDPYIQLMKAYLSRENPENCAVEKAAIDMLFETGKTAMFSGGV